MKPMFSTDRTKRRRAADARPQLTFLIPVYNEAESLPILFEGILKHSAPYSCEVLFIDDGSTDQSYATLQHLHSRRPDAVRIIRFRRNFGKSQALRAGFRAARGELVFTMDADLQDDPAEIPAFIEKLETGYDLVSGWKKKRNDPWGKTLPSRLFNAVIARLSGLQLHDFNCGFKLYRRETLKELDLYGEMHRFIPAFVHARGFRVGEMEVRHHARKFGVSKFGWRRLYRGLFDAITVTLLTRYAKRPLHFFGGPGLLLILTGAGILGYFTVWKLLGHDIGYRPLFFGGILAVIAGLQTFATGLIGELLVSQTGRRADVYSIAAQIDADAKPARSVRNRQAG
jgi:glycosyltransferase involved in cell wall biosynthesis